MTRTAWRLFLSLSFFYLLGTGGTIDTPDGLLMFRVTRSLVERVSLAVAEIPDSPGWGGVRVTDPVTGEERFFSKYGLGLSLAAVPGCLIGKGLAPLARDGEKDLFAAPAGRRARWFDTTRENFGEAFEAFGASWTNSFVIAATLSGVFLICRGLGFGPGPSLGTALIGGLATPLWPYSKTFFSEPLGGLGLTFFFVFALRGSRGRSGRFFWFLSGAFLGLAVLAKPSLAALLLPAPILLVKAARGLARPEVRLRILAFAAGLLPFLGASLIANRARFGAWWETGYGDEILRWTTPWREGLAGLLVSPGRGLLIYFPLWILLLFASARFARRCPAESMFILGSLAVLLALHAKWYRWEGGWCWGPRFLIPVVPLLVVPIAALLENPPTRLSGRVLVSAVILLAFLVAFSGTWVNSTDYHDRLFESFGDPASLNRQGVASFTDLYRWSWSDAPIVRYWSLPAEDNFLILRAVRKPGLVLALFGLWTIGFLVTSCRLIRPRAPRSS